MRGDEAIFASLQTWLDSAVDASYDVMPIVRGGEIKMRLPRAPDSVFHGGVFDDSSTPVSIDSITCGCQIGAVVQVSALWKMGACAGLLLDAMQLRVSTTVLRDCLIIQEDDPYVPFITHRSSPAAATCLIVEEN